MIRARRSGTTPPMPQRSVDTLIVGAGIAGLLLARELRRRGQRVAVAHDPSRPGASEAAVGLLNPVRGRRCTLAWRAQETLAAARTTYQALSAAAGCTFVRECAVVRAFASEEEQCFLERRASAIEAAGFTLRCGVRLPDGLRAAPFGTVAVLGAASVDVISVLEHLRAGFRDAGALVEQRCEDLDFGNPASIRWPEANLTAERAVLCGGSEGRVGSPAGPLPLRPVHGESLLVSIEGLEGATAFVCGHHLAPLGGGLWSCGGTKTPGDASPAATPDGRAELEKFLRAHLAVPWRVVDHRAGVRGATVDTRPLAGRWGADPRLFVFNGLGSQGYAAGPWLARIMADHLVDGAALPSEVDPCRFAPKSRTPAETRWDAVDVARAIVLEHLAPGDLAIDLTVGNGGDTLALARAVGADGAVLGLDIQNSAIQSTSRRLARSDLEACVELRCADHADLARHVPGHWRGRVGAAVANLGHLPGSDSPVATMPGSTIAAFTVALESLRTRGVLVAVIYTHHPGGAAELKAVERWAGGLDSARWQVRWQRAPDLASRAPVVLAVVRA